MTREHSMLPKCNRDSESDQYVTWMRGFGYLPLTNDYKVIEIDGLRTVVLVYTLGIGSGNGWRNVGRFDKSGDASVEYGVFANGTLHWVNRIGGRVFVFCLIEEKFREHVSPPPFKRGGCMLYKYYIGILGGDIYFAFKYGCSITMCTCSDIWQLKGKNDIRDMKGQAEQEMGWSKDFSFTGNKPFALTKTGGVLCFYNRSLGIYGAITSTLKELLDFGAFSQIFPHRNTLGSLQEFEEDIKMMKSAEIEETESRFFPDKAASKIRSLDTIFAKLLK